MGTGNAAADPAVSQARTAVHCDIAGLDSAEAALAATPDGDRVELWSPPDAAEIHGILWYVALQRVLAERHRGRAILLVLDCGGRGDLAIEALRAGLPAVALVGAEPFIGKVVDIAGQLGGQVFTRPVC